MCFLSESECAYICAFMCMCSLGQFNVGVCVCGEFSGIMVIVVKNGPATHFQKPDESVCITQRAKILRKSMNPTILPPTMKNSWAD